MARKRISEYKAKQILHNFLALAYNGLQVNEPTSSQKVLDYVGGTAEKYVVKVDQGVKGRMKKGLVTINADKQMIEESIKKWQNLGYSQFIVEEMFVHDAQDDKFISLERERDGIVVTYSNLGGINIEDNKNDITRVVFSPETAIDISKDLHLPSEFIQKLIQAFDTYYFSFLEINPLVVVNDKVHILDLAVEVDDAAEFFVGGIWSRKDYIDTNAGKKTEEEKNIEVLAQDSPASLKLNVFNKDGSIFLLLSGGGASIALADEVYNQGFGKDLANYGEYSGNPNEEETYTYTKNILSLLLKSSAPRKVLIIAGGVANFTDIRKTFKGVIRALRENTQEMRAQHIKVFVRRGGPYQKEGLQHMKEFLEKEGLYGYVVGPEMMLTDIIKKGIDYVKD